MEYQTMNSFSALEVHFLHNRDFFRSSKSNMFSNVIFNVVKCESCCRQIWRECAIIKCKTDKGMRCSMGRHPSKIVMKSTDIDRRYFASECRSKKQSHPFQAIKVKENNLCTENGNFHLDGNIEEDSLVSVAVSYPTRLIEAHSSKLKNSGKHTQLKQAQDRKKTQDVYYSPKPSPPRTGEKETARFWYKQKASWLEDPGFLAKSLFRAARNNIRDDALWRMFGHRVAVAGMNMNPEQITLCLYSFARIKYRDLRVFKALAPIILKSLADFSAKEMVLILTSFKKLDVPKYDTIELLVNEICLSITKCSCLDLSLVANVLSYFYIYHAKFWKNCIEMISIFTRDISVNHAVILVSSLARIDLRDGRCLLTLAKVTKKNVLSLSQDQLAIATSSFAKLDFTHPKLCLALNRGVHVFFDKYPQDGGKFDLQSLILILHANVCFAGISQSLFAKLINAISQKFDSISSHQKRKLYQVHICLQFRYPELYSYLDFEMKNRLQFLENNNLSTRSYGSRWTRELGWNLQQLGVSFIKPNFTYCSDSDFFLEGKAFVIKCVGPYHHYLDSNRRTAFSKLEEEILRFLGYEVVTIPYFEWSELHTPEQKQRYLWSLGRRTAEKLSIAGTKDYPMQDEHKSAIK